MDKPTELTPEEKLQRKREVYKTFTVQQLSLLMALIQQIEQEVVLLNASPRSVTMTPQQVRSAAVISVFTGHIKRKMELDIEEAVEVAKAQAVVDKADIQ